MSAFRHAAREVSRSHLVDHSAHGRGSPAYRDWAGGQVLHLAAVYSNPCRYEARKNLFNDFRRHAATLPNVRLYVGELAYGDRPFEVTTAGNQDDFQWRTRHELWHKENLINLVVRQFDHGWEYGGYCDGDFTWSRHDLGLEAVHALQHYDWAQLFSHYTDLGPDHRPLGTFPGFAYAYEQGVDVHGNPVGNNYGWPGAPGGCWAFRREAFEACGGLLDTCVLGSGDHHMALGLVGWQKDHPDLHCGDAYARSIKLWQARAYAAVRGNIGYVPAHACHHFHGPRRQRGYDWRWRILKDNAYDPRADIYPDARGVYQLTPDKPRLRDDIRRYFRGRNEDDVRTT